VRYLSQQRQNRFTELTLSDSSEVALTMAAGVLPPDVARYQIDLLNLCWTNRWSKEFLEVGKKRLAGDTVREATTDKVKGLRDESLSLKVALVSSRSI
jgi:hypothetical protein